ncbi:MAG: HlyD family efflux transporter periplasmic adaptor subunit, partial [Holophagales bacterium]|nr:HlyD family efflux transporter periplasmic adaptor subunit [Holophagales bacterium]
MHRTTKTVLFLLIPAIAVGLWTSSRAAPPSVEEPAVEGPSSAAEPPAAVHALGRLEPSGTVLRIGVPAGNEGSCVGELRVAERQQVKSGQILAHMDTFAKKKHEVLEAEARVEAARARLRQIEAGGKRGETAEALAEVRRAAHRLEARGRSLRRAEALFRQGIVAPQIAEDERSAYEEAAQEHQMARARLASVQEVRRVDVELQRAEIAVAESELATARADLGTAVARAPRAGQVLRIHARPGERPGEKGLLELGDVSRMQAVAEVFEGDLGRVAGGAAATVELLSTGRA